MEKKTWQEEEEPPGVNTRTLQCGGYCATPKSSALNFYARGNYQDSTGYEHTSLLRLANHIYKMTRTLKQSDQHGRIVVTTLHSSTENSQLFEYSGHFGPRQHTHTFRCRLFERQPAQTYHISSHVRKIICWHKQPLKSFGSLLSHCTFRLHRALRPQHQRTFLEIRWPPQLC